MQLNKIPITIFIILAVAIASNMVNANAAVESLGEINVKGDDQGRVPAGSTVTLIITLAIDRSLAEPGEEIKTFEIGMPIGFETESNNFKSITRSGEKIEAVTTEVSDQFFQVVLGEADVIDDFSSSIVEITFDAKASDIPGAKAEFSVLMKNLSGIAIGDSIKPGNSDSKDNNNKFTLTIIPNQPPEPVRLIKVEADPNGENDVVVRWEQSNDPDVTGYWIYRDDAEPINAPGREINFYIDVNVPEGTHEYSIAAYKTPLVKSERSETMSVDVKKDQASPSPPTNLTLTTISDGVELKWEASPSYDVVKYVISSDTLEEDEVVDAEPGKKEYERTFPVKLSVGKFVYGIEAIDEVGNRSEIVFKTSYVLREPYPNPFTPLSSNPDYNKVIFPERALEGVMGEFSVKLYNLDGVLVKELVAGLGEIELAWDGKDEDGEIAESGIYVYQIQVGDSYKTGTIILAK